MKNPLKYPSEILIENLIKIHPFLYDFYFFHFKDIQQGSIPKRYIEPPWNKNQPHCVIFTNRYWLVHTAIEIAFAKERQKNGYNVTVIGCGGAVPQCDNHFYKGSPWITHECGHCSYLLRKLCERCGVKYISVKEYLEKSSLPYSSGSQTRDYEKLVYSSWIRLLRSINPLEEEEYELKKQLIESCKIFDSFFVKFFNEYSVDEVIMLNGKFFAENLLSQHCRERNIPFITYEKGVLSNTVMFGQNKPAVPPDTMEKWAKNKHQSLSDEQKQRIYQYLGERMAGNSADSKFISEFNRNKKEICDKYSLNLNKTVTVLFSNIIWDSSVVGEDRIFGSMFDWIESTIQYYESQDDKQLVIRAHPVEIKMNNEQKTRNRVNDYINDKFHKLNNVIIIPPESNTSSYILMELADLGLVYSSTTGLEMALKNKPVIVAGNPHYIGTEFVYSPETKEEYLELLSQTLSPLPNQVECAERYAYMYFVEHMVSFDDIIRQVGSNYQFVNDIEKSTILKRGGF